MPKQILKINDFSGGINNSADPRDIEDNEFVELKNFTIKDSGRLHTVGDLKSNYRPLIQNVTGHGRGFIAFRTDYDQFDGNLANANGHGGAAAETSSRYYLAQRGTNGMQATNTTDTTINGNVFL